MPDVPVQAPLRPSAAAASPLGTGRTIPPLPSPSSPTPAPPSQPLKSTPPPLPNQEAQRHPLLPRPGGASQL